MDKEKKSAFSFRISKSNRTELIVIMYDMLEVYLEDAVTCRKEENRDGFKEQLRAADKVLAELQSILDFTYEISADLYRLYTYCRTALRRSMYRFDTSGIEEARVVLKSLGAAFRELAKQDNSAPLMKNTENISYGMTYGRSDISETVSSDNNRGFFA